MYASFANPFNTRSTGVLFIKTILFKENIIIDGKEYSLSSLFKRFFSLKKKEPVIFFPLTYKCFLARKEDVVILPDDSMRSISSVAKIRLRDKIYIKFLYQCCRYLFTYLLIMRLRNCTQFTVSQYDLSTLRKKFPKNEIKYLPHPIQSQYNSDKVSKLNLRIHTIGFINLQSHYSVDVFNFLDKTVPHNIKGFNIIFHGAAAGIWLKNSQEFCNGNNCFKKEFVDDFDEFFNTLDLVIIPLDAGAGVKNILLNSVYKNKLVFGTLEAFSGIPNELSKPFIIKNINDIDANLKIIDSFERRFIELKKYIMSHHTIEHFKRVLVSK